MEQTNNSETIHSLCLQIETILNTCPEPLQHGLLSWIRDLSQQKLAESADSSSEDDEKSDADDMSECLIMLNGIRQDLQHELPLTCELESEKLFYPSDSCELSVDSFVYDSDDLDVALEQGDILLHRCKKCGSRDLQKLEMVTHSLSVGEMVYIYRFAVPYVLRHLKRSQRDIGSNSGCDPAEQIVQNVEPGQPRSSGAETKDRRMLLDIGSRTGAVLFGAYYLYEGDLQLYGIEMDKTFADLSMKIARKYKISGLQVFADDIMTEGKGHSSHLQSAHIVVMHNVFEYFADREKQIRLWKFCLDNLRKNPDLLLITSPSLKESLSKLKMPAETWSFLLPHRVPPSIRKEFLDKYSQRFDIEKDQLNNINIYSHTL